MVPVPSYHRMRNGETRLFALIYYNRLTTLPYHHTNSGIRLRKSPGTSLSCGSYVRKNIYTFFSSACVSDEAVVFYSVPIEVHYSVMSRKKKRPFAMFDFDRLPREGIHEREYMRALKVVDLERIMSNTCNLTEEEAGFLVTSKIGIQGTLVMREALHMYLKTSLMLLLVFRCIMILYQRCITPWPCREIFRSYQQKKRNVIPPL